MRKIIVPESSDESLSAQLLSLYNTFKGSQPREALIFDLSKIDWICPSLALPLSAYISDTKSNFTIDDFSNIKSYLEIINFPSGIDSISEFQQKIQKDKSYIPISVLKKEAGKERGRLESMFSRMVYENLKAIPGTEDAVYYPVTELIGNIFEHSKKNEGFVFAQCYPKKEHLDICIVDRGRGLKTSYREEKGLKLSDEASIEEAMKGTSTKPGRERGYGLWTSKRVVCEGMEGEFMLLSGSAALVSITRNEKLFSLPDFNWQGVIIAYRIPSLKKPIDIYQYIE